MRAKNENSAQNQTPNGHPRHIFESDESDQPDLSDEPDLSDLSDGSAVVGSVAIRCVATSHRRIGARPMGRRPEKIRAPSDNPHQRLTLTKSSLPV